MADYEFRYAPLTGRLTGNQMIEQTEQAINQLSALVDSAAGQVEIISTLANEANENAATALETAEEALATTGRTYITVSTQTDANNYYDSQLIYIADSTSTNIPVADTGMLEVKTNDNKTSCEQVFIADSSGDAYYRNGDISAETVGDVTTYTVTWGGWSSQPASQQYVQQELTNYAPLASLNDYLPLSGGTVSGDLTVTGNIAGSLVGNVTGLASGNLPLAGGTMTGAIKYAGTNSEEFSLGLSSATNVDFGWTYGNKDGAIIGLRSNSDTNSGEFELSARNKSLSKSLIGKPDGTLTWGGKKVERVNASGSNYIRYESGLQICWGESPSVKTSGVVLTFPVPFSAPPKAAVSGGSGTVTYGWSNINATTITLRANTSSGIIVYYIAIGYWK